MAKSSSKFVTLLGRLVKVAMVAVVLPFAVSLLLSALEQLNVPSVSGFTVREWIVWGALTYTGVHLLLYRPAALFRVSHRIFAALAIWLFGGHVASVEEPSGGKGKKGGKGAPGEVRAQGSTLVAFSPYVIPLYTVLVCAAAWGFGRWLDRAFVDGPFSFLVGMTMAFQWLMSADELQQQRERWHLETYFLSISLVFALTVLIAGACLPWAVPEFSFARAFAEGSSRAQAVYTTLIQRLFF